MEAKDILTDAFGRIRPLVESSIAGLDAGALAYRPDPDANSIGWLIWHLTRVQDHHVSEIAGRDQAWIDDWADRFGLPANPDNTGYGHSSEQVGAVRPDGTEILIAYHKAVSDRTMAYLARMDPKELQRIIDYRWDPPVSVGVRLVSVIGDSLQHLGQARYVRGMWERRGSTP